MNDLRFRQNRFCQHLAWMLNWIPDNTDLTVSLGRAYDIPEVQPLLIEKGLSHTLNSMHSKRLAVDLNFFMDDYYLLSDDRKWKKDFELIRPIGEYWCSLHPDNRWGGHWLDKKGKPKDVYHFEHYFP